jgi:hypothetical protein
VSDYIEADGLRMPGKRRAYRRGKDGLADMDALLVAIDLSEIGYS